MRGAPHPGCSPGGLSLGRPKPLAQWLAAAHPAAGKALAGAAHAPVHIEAISTVSFRPLSVLVWAAHLCAHSHRTHRAGLPGAEGR